MVLTAARMCGQPYRRRVSAVWRSREGEDEDHVHGQDRSDRRRPPELPGQCAPHAGGPRVRSCRRGRGRRCCSARRRTASARDRPPRRPTARHQWVRGREVAARGHRSDPSGRPDLEPRLRRLERSDRDQRGPRVHSEGRADRDRPGRDGGMSNSRRTWLSAVAVVLLGGICVTFMVLGSTGTHAIGIFASRGLYLSYLLLIGCGFAGTGLYAWNRRPGNRVGPLMTVAGCVWLVRGLEVSSDGRLFALGALAAPWAYAVLTHLLLAFPSGRLESWPPRLLATIAYVNVTALQLLAFLFTDTRATYAGCLRCPPNPVLVTASGTAVGMVVAAQGICALLVLFGLVVVLERRWRVATAGQRRSLTPVLVTGAMTLGFLAVSVIGVAPGATDIFILLTVTCFAFVPFAFLLGLLRSRFGEAEAVTLVVKKLGADSGRSALRDALAEALGDPFLRLAYWVPEIASYVDSDGSPVRLPEPDDGVIASLISHDGEPLAAVIHNASVAEDGNLIQTVSAAVELTLRNERLDAELRARVAELRASRARIVEASDEQRRRIERNLHDGAQQRLMALGIDMRLARDQVASNPAEAVELLDAALHELGEATAELRELARGIHPSVLTNRGLDAALQALAGRSPVPVVIVAPGHRFPSPIESAVYFVVAEALTNATRYASAREITVSILDRHGVVEVEVRDDGIGGANPEHGSGLRGIHDRIAALDGHLELASVGGEGTTLRVRLPCG